MAAELALRNLEVQREDQAVLTLLPLALQQQAAVVVEQAVNLLQRAVQVAVALEFSKTVRLEHQDKVTLVEETQVVQVVQAEVVVQPLLVQVLLQAIQEQMEVQEQHHL